MPDISMCMGNKCPIRETCYRYTATPSGKWQSYFGESAWDGAACEYFWNNKEKI